MPNYKALYYRLMYDIEQAMQILTEVQNHCKKVVAKEELSDLTSEDQ